MIGKLDVSLLGFFILGLSFFSDAFAAETSSSLVVYTSDSFVSEWGPGPTIKTRFEKECQCSLKFVPLADGAAVLARLQIEKKGTKADVVVGLEDSLTSMADKMELFSDSGIALQNSNLPAGYHASKVYVAYDYGYYAFMFDTKAKNKSGDLYPRPKSLEDLIQNSKFAKSVIVQDPRTSAPGLGLLLWFHAQFKAAAADKLSAFKKQVLTTSRGWSEAYNLFNKGEAPIVFSYTTSEAYHRDQEKTDRYQALIFDEGHYPSIETAAIVKYSKNKALAIEFIKFLLRPDIQSVVASKNWMYPVTPLTSGLPTAYGTIKQPTKIFRVSSEQILNNRNPWIQEWQQIFSR